MKFQFREHQLVQVLLLNTYKITLKYKGTNYFGWQSQNDQVTIQGELNKALIKLSKSQNVKTLGSGRTDAGVHALAQIVKAEISIDIEDKALMRGLNSLLPEDIRVTDCESCSNDFHPVFHAKSKNYRYLFTLEDLTPFNQDNIVKYPHRSFDEKLFKEALALFVGEHDFQNYFCVGTEVKTTTRTIYEAKLEKVDREFVDGEQNVFILNITGSGFLKQMVRLIVGALFHAASGKVSIESIKDSLIHKIDKKLGPVAPAEGLYLASVSY